MAARPLLVDRGDLEGLFDELADELHHRGLSVEIVMVGGSWMLWNGDRAATRDVDSAKRLEADAKEVIRDVGDRHELAPEWLNDHAASFWPRGVSLDLPHAPEDEHLADFVAEVAQDAADR